MGTAVSLVAEEVRQNGGKAIAVPGDVTDPTFAERIISETIK